MKRQPLSSYLERLKFAIDKMDLPKAKQLGEAVLKKLPALSYTPAEEYLLYRRLGVAYYELAEYSRSLEACYKARWIATKHHLPPENTAYLSLLIGHNFLIIKDINKALAQFHKVEEYYQKYGDADKPMDKTKRVTLFIGLAYCYLHREQWAEAREVIEVKIPSLLVGASNENVRFDYHHLKGEYLISVKEYDRARESFRECLKIARGINLADGVLASEATLAYLDLLEGYNEEAIKTLQSVLKESQRLRLKHITCEVGLLLSKCYFLRGLPERAAAVEKQIKPVLATLDTVWLYEKAREFEKLYHRLQTALHTSATDKSLSYTPLVLTDTLNHRYQQSPYRNIIIGKSRPMEEIWHLVEKIAPTGLPVLLQGETGTGKELVVHALYQHSPRAAKPILAFNCGAMPETLLESGLFGHTKGAFTGAVEEKKGYIELASGGALFIDEVGNMSPAMQQKLLRVLEEKQVWRVGAQKPVAVDTRFIFASNQNIEDMVKHKLFREDLFYRINTIVINLPPLRDRSDDIPLLIQHFLGKYSSKTQDAKRITPDALALMTAYPWPGNVRELENEIKRICVLYPEITLIDESHLSESIRHSFALISPSSGERSTIKHLTDRFHAQLINETIRKCRGNINQVARSLGYSRRGLYKRMKQLKINPSLQP